MRRIRGSKIGMIFQDAGAQNAVRHSGYHANVVGHQDDRRTKQFPEFQQLVHHLPENAFGTATPLSCPAE